MIEIVAVIVSVILFIVIGLIGAYAKGLERRLDKTTAKADNNENEIIKLIGKLWSEDKLEKTVEGAVERAFLGWENKLLKNGFLKQ